MTRYTEWPKEKLEEVLDESVSFIGLSVRTNNQLERKGITTIRELLSCSKEDLMKTRNFGEKSYEEVMKALRATGFY